MLKRVHLHPPKQGQSKVFGELCNLNAFSSNQAFPVEQKPRGGMFQRKTKEVKNLPCCKITHMERPVVKVKMAKMADFCPFTSHWMFKYCNRAIALDLRRLTEALSKVQRIIAYHFK